MEGGLFLATLSLALLSLCFSSPVLDTKTGCEEAPNCSPADCQAPDCHCSGVDSGVEIDKRPQIVYITFDDALTSQASEQFYEPLFDGSIKNPNGCDIRGTHFITHSYTDYSLANHYWHKGHEIAIHSITHRTDTNYWKSLDKAGWVNEMVGMRKMVGQFAALDPCQMTGIRAPYLQAGGDTMFEMMEEHNFLYDSSWPSRQFGYIDAMNGMYPYSLDYASVQDCEIEPCPKCSHPGKWVQPMIDLEDEWIGANPQYPDNGMPCSMLDACIFINNMTAEHVYGMLMKNFERVYLGGTDDFGDQVRGNRAPWGLYMHAAWFFGQQWHFDGYMMFVKEISSYDDVWIVPVKNGIEYMQNPMTQEKLMELGKSDESPFGCQSIEDKTGIYDNTKFRCGNAMSCRFEVDLPDDGQHGERYMHICSHKSNADGSDSGKQNCPDIDRYPWLGEENHCGGNVPCNDCQA